VKDPSSGLDAAIHDDGTASPTIGPDGDVYFGVLESPLGSHHFRGWLLHFDASLAPAGVPGGFGWDDTASIVPSSMVPSYAGHVAVPALRQVQRLRRRRRRRREPHRRDRSRRPDARSDLGRADHAARSSRSRADAGRRQAAALAERGREWCINTGAVDPATKSILVNNEDGKLYRWSMTTGTLSESIVLTPGCSKPTRRR
jgi:hypothetical protein